MNKIQAHRPSLIDWSTVRLDTTPFDDGDMDYLDEEGRSQESKAQAKVDVGINHGDLKNNRNGRKISI